MLYVLKPSLVFPFSPRCEVSSWRLRKPPIIEESLTTSELGSCMLGQSFRSLRALPRSAVQCRAGGRAKRQLQRTPTPPPVQRDPQRIVLATSPRGQEILSLEEIRTLEATLPSVDFKTGGHRAPDIGRGGQRGGWGWMRASPLPRKPAGEDSSGARWPSPIRLSHPDFFLYTRVLLGHRRRAQKKPPKRCVSQQAQGCLRRLF